MTIPVYSNDERQEIIGRVKYNDNLDFWDGKNMTCGSTGRHKGLTRLRKSGQYVLIHGSQWQGEKNYAYVIEPKQALREILNSENLDLLDKFPELQKLYEEMDSDE